MQEKITGAYTIDMPNPLGPPEDLSAFWRELKTLPPSREKQDAQRDFQAALQERRKRKLPLPKLDG